MDNAELLKLEHRQTQRKNSKRRKILQNCCKKTLRTSIYCISWPAYYESQDIDKAIAVFKKILGLDPTNIDALNSLGYSLAVRAGLDDAEAMSQSTEFQAARRLHHGCLVGYIHARTS